MARAKEKVRLAKIGEQPGFLGIGKFEVDVYYKDIKHRMNTVKSKLEKSGKQRELHRQSRKRLGFKTISLAGYTSAGKTTLFNKLTGEVKQQSAQLFTTLSTTTRRVTINHEPFLISDTVGFISKLPAYMIEAFKSTLEELLHTSIVLVIIDASDSVFETKKKLRSCNKTLMEIGVETNKIIYVLNKADLLDQKEISRKVKYLELDDGKRWIPVSSKTGENLRQLKELIAKVLPNQNTVRSNKKTLKEEMDKLYGN